MNSHNWESIDSLFEQALQPYTKAKPPVSVWEQILLRFQPSPWSPLRRLFSWLPAMITPFSMISAPSLPAHPQCHAISLGRSYASPFVGAVIHLVWDRKLAS